MWAPGNRKRRLTKRERGRGRGPRETRRLLSYFRLGVEGGRKGVGGGGWFGLVATRGGTLCFWFFLSLFLSFSLSLCLFLSLFLLACTTSFPLPFPPSLSLHQAGFLLFVILFLLLSRRPRHQPPSSRRRARRNRRSPPL